MDSTTLVVAIDLFDGGFLNTLIILTNTTKSLSYAQNIKRYLQLSLSLYTISHTKLQMVLSLKVYSRAS